MQSGAEFFLPVTGWFCYTPFLIFVNFDELVKNQKALVIVIPAKAGIQECGIPKNLPGFIENLQSVEVLY